MSCVAEDSESSASTEPRVLAIDVLLEPNETMLAKAAEANERLRGNYSDSFTLDADHATHITVVQRFVLAERLNEIESAIASVIAQARILEETFDASGYCYLPYENLGVAAVTVEPSAELKSFQEMVIEAICPLVVNSGDGSAFVSPADGTEINQLTIDYVNAYVPDYSGTQFNPHVTVGIANQQFLDDLIAEPFEAFSFKARSVSIYQLGNFGAAQKKLRSLGQ